MLEHRGDDRLDRQHLDRGGELVVVGEVEQLGVEHARVHHVHPDLGAATRSTSIDSDHAVIAAFDAVYAASAGGPRRAATDEMFTIRPARCSMPGSSASVSRTGEK